MANPFDAFDNPLARTARDVGTELAAGTVDLGKMVGDLAYLTTGKDNALRQVSKSATESLEKEKSPELVAAEEDRQKAIDAEKDPFHQALAYVKKTFSDPELAATSLARMVPSVVAPGGVGASTRVAAGKLLAKGATELGVGAAVGAGAGLQAAGFGGAQMDRLVKVLDEMPEEQAKQIPQIADMMENKGATLKEAKTAAALEIARRTALSAGLISAASQLVPGGRTIERALVGGAEGAMPGIGGRMLGAAKGALGEATQASLEQGGSQAAANLLARPAEPEREAMADVGPAVGQAAMLGGAMGAAAGAISRPKTTPQPVPESRAAAGVLSGEQPAPAATTEKTALTKDQQVDLTKSGEMTPEEFNASVNVRDAQARGMRPSPEDTAAAGNAPRGRVEVDPALAEQARTVTENIVNDWRKSNKTAPENIEVVFDPNWTQNGYGVRGAFDDATGGIKVNAAFIRSPEEVHQVIRHEWTHHTLSSPDGMAMLAQFAERSIPKTELDEIASRYGTADRLKLVDEWIAQNQEKAPGVLRQMVEDVKIWIKQKLGIELSNGEAVQVMLRTLREAEGRDMAAAKGVDERLSLTRQREPYGYWIDRSGNPTEVRDWGGHAEVAQKIHERDFGAPVQRSFESSTLSRQGYLHVSGVGGSEPIIHVTNSATRNWDDLPRYQREAVLKIAEKSGKGVYYNGQPIGELAGTGSERFSLSKDKILAKGGEEESRLTEPPADLNKIPHAPPILASEAKRALPESRFYVSSDERGADFRNAIARTAKEHPFGSAVEVKPDEFYTDPANRLFLDTEGLAGAAVKADGDPVSVFKHPESKANMKAILADAAKISTKLDGFDINHTGFLPSLYSNFGFRPVARVAFDEAFAPPGWDYAKLGRPDNVFMVRDPEGILKLPDSTLYNEVRDQVPLVSYDEALRMQQEALGKIKEKSGMRYSLTKNRMVDQDRQVEQEQLRHVTTPGFLKADSEGYIPKFITESGALPTVVVGKNKGTEVPVISFNQYANTRYTNRGESKYAGSKVTLAETHIPTIQESYSGLDTRTYKEKDPRRAAEMVVNDMADNLLFLHDLAGQYFGKDVVERMSKWYDGANVIAKKFAEKYGITIQQSAAILASLSPQKHWFANVSLAENVMDVMRNHQDTTFTPDVEKAAYESITKSKGTKKSKDRLKKIVAGLVGKKLSELSDLDEKATFTRFLSQVIHPEKAYIVTPEGKLTPNSSVAVAWSGTSPVVNAIMAFMDGSPENLTQALGEGHKVRNFYGNIIDPKSPLFYTSDTHNVAGSLLIPVGGTASEVMHNFGGNPDKGEANAVYLPVLGTRATGLQGTYPLFVEAGRRAAEQRGILPRQMQSITWEMIRILFTDDMKTDQFLADIKNVHSQVRSGKISLADARQKIIDMSGGEAQIKARPPEWLNQ